MARTLDRGRARAVATSVTAVVAAALLPKCPACVAVWLAALGAGGSAAALSPLLRPSILAVAVAAAAFAACSYRRPAPSTASRRSVERRTCCD